MVQLGQKIPDFIVPATSQKNVHLDGLKGYKVLLYFYPKDNTPSCTIENQDFAANYHHFKEHNTLVFGISRDSLASHEEFKAAQALPFELISDEHCELCKLFDVLHDKEFFGKTITSLSRSTFLIDESGCLIKEWRQVDVRDHVHNVIAFLENDADTNAVMSKKTG